MITVAQRVDAAGVWEMAIGLRSRYRYVTTWPIGQSVLGKPIVSLQIGQSDDPVLYLGGTHGAESITALVLLRFCENICRTLTVGGRMAGVDLRRAMAGRGVVIVPLLNPDGADIACHGASVAGPYAELVARSDKVWQANARGVDLNHNFDADWAAVHKREQENGIVAPAARRYGGEAPESEPETGAICDLCRQIPFRHALSLHTQGEEIYWQCGEKTPPRSRLMAEILSASSGYRLAEPTGLAVGGGFTDWFLSAFGRPAFTLEMGKGKNPLPFGMFEELYAKAEEMLVLAALM